MLAANPPRLGRRLWSYVTLARLRKRAARTRRAPRAAHLTPSNQAARTSKALQPVLNGMQPRALTKFDACCMVLSEPSHRAVHAIAAQGGGRLADWPRLAEALCGAARQPTAPVLRAGRLRDRASAEPYRHTVTTCHPGILQGILGQLGLVAELLDPTTDPRTLTPSLDLNLTPTHIT